jgi:hypothetical protein
MKREEAAIKVESPDPEFATLKSGYHNSYSMFYKKRFNGTKKIIIIRKKENVGNNI